LYVEAQSIERNDRPCEKPAHGSTRSPRAGRVSLQFNRLSGRL